MSKQEIRWCKLGCFAIFLAFGASTAALGAAGPFLSAQFSVSIGLMVAVYNFGALLAVIAIGLGVDRVPWSWLMVTFFVFLLAGSSVFWATDTRWVFLLANWCSGMGFGGVALLINSSFAQHGGGSVAINSLNAMFGFGAVLGPALAALFDQSEVRRLWLIIALLVALSWPLVHHRVGPAHRPARPEREPVHERSIMTAGFFCCLGIGFFYAGFETGIGAWLSSILVEDGWSIRQATFLAGMYWLGIACGRLIIPRLTIRCPPQAAILAYLLIATGLSLVGSLSGSALITYALVGVAISAVLPSVMSLLATESACPAKTTALLAIACMAGNALVPIGVSNLVEYFSLAVGEVLVIAVAGAAASAIGLWGLSRARTRIASRS